MDERSERPTPPTMPESRWARLWDLFHRALELDSEARTALLVESCPGDPELRRQVEELLEAHETSAALLDRTPPIEPPPAEDALEPGQAVGPYRVLEKIAGGGMGTVYLAEQKEPVERRVALKTIKWGMDTREVISRFRTERRALAKMSHPNIAVALDAGATASGRPYFAMEHVDGEPFTRYCDRRRLGLGERLRLFQAVCRGVQHAHYKGILHRDLKPSNVLVAEVDGEPLPKVIDFGVAKAMEPGGGVESRAGGRIGTPHYMSPEQWLRLGNGVDTRSDIYSLGVFLFEVLTGGLPFPRPSSSADQEALERLRTEPPAASRAVARLEPAAAEEVAERRGTSARRLVRDLQGDLDWILARAMAPDPEVRYASVAELAADLERHLASQPVLAGPPSALYRLGKWVRRHRLSFSLALVAALLALALVVSLAVSTVRLRRALDRAALEHQRSEEVTAFLVDSFELSDPSSVEGRTITAREVLDRGAARIGDRLADQPALRWRLMEVISGIYSKLGLQAQTIELLSRVVDERRRDPGSPGEELAAALHELGAALRRDGRLEAARAPLEEALELRGAAFGPRHPEVAATLHQLGTLALRRNDFEAARTALEEALAIRRETRSDPVDVANSLNNLGVLELATGNFAEAEARHREALAVRRRHFGEKHSDVAASYLNLARVFDSQGKNEQSEVLHEKSLEIWRQIVGPEHPRVAISLINLSRLAFRRGAADEALALLEEARAIREKISGPDHPMLLIIRHNAAEILANTGEREEAERRLRRLVEDRRRIQGDRHPDTARSLLVLSSLVEERGDLAGSEAMLREALDIRAEGLGEHHWRTADARGRLGDLLRRQRRYAEAESLLLRGWEDMKAAFGAEHAWAREAARRLEVLYDAQGRADEAETWRRRAEDTEALMP